MFNSLEIDFCVKIDLGLVYDSLVTSWLLRNSRLSMCFFSCVCLSSFSFFLFILDNLVYV